MAVLWSALLDRAKNRYGLDTSHDDPLLNDRLFLARCNELLSELAGVGEGFRRDLTLNLPTTSVVVLPAGVIRVIDQTLRIDRDGDGVFELEPAKAQERALRKSYGVLENQAAGVPGYYYTQRGEDPDELLSLVLYPRSDTARTNGLKCSAQVVPPAITGPASEVPVLQSEERFVIPGLCLALAEAEFSRGKRDAPLDLWSARWEKALSDYADEVGEGMESGPRSMGWIDHWEGE